jgi:MFS family permease
MWELYTFWAFVPVLIGFFRGNDTMQANDSLLSFFVIAAGAFSCALGGMVSNRIGSSRVAQLALVGSGVCCILVLFAAGLPSWIWIALLLIWGIFITADSPQFSTLVAQSVPAEYRGTALTLVNSLGFALSVISIQLAEYLLNWLRIDVALALLVIGPVSGLLLFRFYASQKGIE